MRTNLIYITTNHTIRNRTLIVVQSFSYSIHNLNPKCRLQMKAKPVINPIIKLHYNLKESMKNLCVFKVQ